MKKIYDETEIKRKRKSRLRCCVSLAIAGLISIACVGSPLISANADYPAFSLPNLDGSLFFNPYSYFNGRCSLYSEDRNYFDSVFTVSPVYGFVDGQSGFMPLYTYTVQSDEVVTYCECEVDGSTSVVSNIQLRGGLDYTSNFTYGFETLRSIPTYVYDYILNSNIDFLDVNESDSFVISSVDLSLSVYVPDTDGTLSLKAYNNSLLFTPSNSISFSFSDLLPTVTVLSNDHAVFSSHIYVSELILTVNCSFNSDAWLFFSISPSDVHSEYDYYDVIAEEKMSLQRFANLSNKQESVGGGSFDTAWSELSNYLSSSIPKWLELFYDPTSNRLTFVGYLSVAVVGIGLMLLIINVIKSIFGRW